MAGVSMDIHLNGLHEMQNLLHNYAQSIAGNRAELHMRYGTQALNWIDQNFRAQGGLLSTGPWAKLRPNTVAGRRKGTSLVLQDSGPMRESYQMNFNGEQVVVGSADPKALWHGEGTKPYTIRPKKPGGVLAIPIAESLATPSRLKEMGIVKTKASFSSIATRKTFRKGGFVMFRKEVHHPGLPARRVLPRENELLPQLLKTTINFLHELQTKGQIL